MAISTEINRISRAKRDIREALDLIKIKIPVSEKLDKYPKYIRFPDYKSQPLTAEFFGSGTDTIYYNGETGVLSYSLDYGKTWIPFVENDELTVSNGDTVMFKGSMRHNNYGSDIYILEFPHYLNFNVSGNISSLVYPSNFANATTFPSGCSTPQFFRAIFRHSGVVSAENLILPLMSSYCYSELFEDCTYLTTPPALPATTLANSCYEYMFNDCTSLTTAPKLPATTLADGCYLAMFNYCTSLTTAPVLPAATLADHCYENMFYGCSSLNYIKCLATDISATDCTSDWVNGVAQTGTFVKSVNMTNWVVDSVNGIPTGWTVIDYVRDYSQDYFTIEITGSGDGYISGSSDVFYSLDNGQTWNRIEYGLSVNSGDIIMFRGNMSEGNAGSPPIWEFPRDTTFNAYGNIASLISPSNFENMSSMPESVFFADFFKYSAIVSAENLILPFTNLDESCYSSMFEDCTSLTTPPALPATTLASYCYAHMFYGCTALTTAPELPATTLGNHCYYEMFKDCTSLTTAASELPATTLATYCYANMFQGCTSLTTAPELPATTLVNGCYKEMFYDCSQLNYIKCLATNISASYCTNYWLYDVAATGTFVKNSNMSSWTTGNSSGIPSGWTVIDYVPS